MPAAFAYRRAPTCVPSLNRSMVGRPGGTRRSSARDFSQVAPKRPEWLGASRRHAQRHVSDDRKRDECRREPSPYRRIRFHDWSPGSIQAQPEGEGNSSVLARWCGHRDASRLKGINVPVRSPQMVGEGQMANPRTIWPAGFVTLCLAGN
jgi:hypothetical protein